MDSCSDEYMERGRAGEEDDPEFIDGLLLGQGSTTFVIDFSPDTCNLVTYIDTFFLKQKKCQSNPYLQRENLKLSASFVCITMFLYFCFNFFFLLRTKMTEIFHLDV